MLHILEIELGCIDEFGGFSRVLVRAGIYAYVVRLLGITRSSSAHLKVSGRRAGKRI